MFRAVLLVSAFAFVACSSSKDEKNGVGPAGKPVPVNRVNWASVPADYNPSLSDINFRTDGAEKIEMDVFGFNNDVEVIYADLPAGTGFLRLFRVYKDSASWGGLTPQSDGKTVKLTSYGSYSCSMSVRNGAITALKGGCYVRLQVFLPTGAQIEVYNVGQLLTPRFVPMSNSEFLRKIDQVSWSDQKFAAISEYLSTYAKLGRAPSLSTGELKTVLGEFFRGEEKLKALSQLHMHVNDRANLGALLDREFMFGERDEARRITGL